MVRMGKRKDGRFYVKGPRPAKARELVKIVASQGDASRALSDVERLKVLRDFFVWLPHAKIYGRGQASGRVLPSIDREDLKKHIIDYGYFDVKDFFDVGWSPSDIHGSRGIIQRLKDTGELPPIIIVKLPPDSIYKFYPIDGFHRLGAHQLLKKEKIRAVLVDEEGQRILNNPRFD